MRHFLVILTVVMGGTALAAQAQTSRSRGEIRPSSDRSRVIFQPQVPFNTVVEVEPHHSSTVAEGVLRGQAAWLRGYGQYLYLRGQGAVSWEQARAQCLCNYDNAVADWYARREVNRQIRFGKPSQPSGVAQPNPRKSLPQRQVVIRVSADGQVYWPDLLMANEYDESRQALDRLFRARVDGNQASLKQAIVKEVGKLHSELRDRIEEYPTAAYLAARKFIEGLRHEAPLNNPAALTRR